MSLSTAPADAVDAVDAVDALTEALLESGDPVTRAEFIYRLTEGLCHGIAARRESELTLSELISLEGVRAAGQYHRHCMTQQAAAYSSGS